MSRPCGRQWPKLRARCWTASSLAPTRKLFTTPSGTWTIGRAAGKWGTGSGSWCGTRKGRRGKQVWEVPGDVEAHAQCEVRHWGGLEAGGRAAQPGQVLPRCEADEPHGGQIGDEYPHAATIAEPAGGVGAYPLQQPPERIPADHSEVARGEAAVGWLIGHPCPTLWGCLLLLLLSWSTLST